MRVAIIGTGIVGKAQIRMLAGHDLVTYDVTDPGPYPYEAIDACDFAVVCAGTPAYPDGSADLTGVWQAFDLLPDAIPVLLRSTVRPRTTDLLAERRSGLTCHAPEFLHEREGGPWRDSTDVPFMILGGTEAVRDYFAARLYRVFPGRVHQCSALEAELAKYAANLHWAAKVTFVNEMAAICGAFGADWEAVRKAWLADERVTPIYTSMAGYEPGFGGRCWPKDLAALIAASRDAGYEPGFLEAVEAANGRFRREAGD